MQAKPGDFVIAPDPEEFAFGVWLAGMAASPIVIKFHDVRQVFARPTAKRFAAFAATVDGIGITDLQDGFVGLLRSFLDAQWEGVEIQDGI